MPSCLPCCHTTAPTKTPSSSDAAAAVAVWASADVAGPDAIAAIAATLLPDLAAVRQYLAAARGSEVALDQGSAEACVARFRALQAEDAGLGWQDLNTFITVRVLEGGLGRGVPQGRWFCGLQDKTMHGFVYVITFVERQICSAFQMQ